MVRPKSSRWLRAPRVAALLQPLHVCPPPQKKIKSLGGTKEKMLLCVFFLLHASFSYSNALPLPGGAKEQQGGLKGSWSQTVLGRASRAGLLVLGRCLMAPRRWAERDRVPGEAPVISGRLERPNTAGLSDRGPGRTAKPICLLRRGRALPGERSCKCGCLIDCSCSSGFP